MWSVIQEIHTVPKTRFIHSVNSLIKAEELFEFCRKEIKKNTIIYTTILKLLEGNRLLKERTFKPPLK